MNFMQAAQTVGFLTLYNGVYFSSPILLTQIPTISFLKISGSLRLRGETLES